MNGRDAMSDHIPSQLVNPIVLSANTLQLQCRQVIRRFCAYSHIPFRVTL